MQEMTQAQYDAIYLQQVTEYQNDQRLQRAVMVLQGLAALVTVVVLIRAFIKN